MCAGWRLCPAVWSVHCHPAGSGQLCWRKCLETSLPSSDRTDAGKVRFPDRLVPEQDNSVTVNLLLFYISETRRDKGLLVNEKQKHIFNMYPCYVSVFSRNLYKKPTASFLSGEGTKLTAKRSVAVVTKDIPECRPV